MGKRRARYEINLLINHPNMSPDTITRRLKLTPHYSWRRGEPRRTPIGMELGGVRSETMWRHVAKEEGRRSFFAGLREFVDRLRVHRRFLSQITSAGGRVELIVNLPGNVNMGDVLKPETLRLIADMGADLGIEVVPEKD
jgi:hypothetical protein